MLEDDGGKVGALEREEACFGAGGLGACVEGIGERAMRRAREGKGGRGRTWCMEGVEIDALRLVAFAKCKRCFCSCVCLRVVV